ncbi:MAG: squalene/phytoene synthase family protein [Pseudomonadota bacterium]|nr:squalene/phytoene synthase family protein [Pseudomonadota bacterium]
MNPDSYCQDRITRSAPELNLALQFTPPNWRASLRALYAVYFEIRNPVDTALEPGVAQAKLQWWSDEIRSAAQGEPHHPATQALLAHLPSSHPRPEQWLELMAGSQMDLTHEGYQTLHDLGLYCYRTGGVLHAMAAGVCGGSDPQTQAVARQLGNGIRLAELIQRTRVLARLGRIYLPAEILKRHEVSHDALSKADAAPEIRAALEELTRAAEKHFEQARDELPSANRAALRTPLLLSKLAEYHLQQLRRNNFRFDPPGGRTEPLRRLWLLWRTAGREARACVRQGHPR